MTSAFRCRPFCGPRTIDRSKSQSMHDPWSQLPKISILGTLARCTSTGESPRLRLAAGFDAPQAPVIRVRSIEERRELGVFFGAYLGRVGRRVLHEIEVLRP